jgi:predicted transcriptional regulator
MMARVTLRTDSPEGFFQRARHAAQNADAGARFEPNITLTFENPARLAAVLSAARCRLVNEVMNAPRSVSELARVLHRDRAAINRDIRLLESAGILTTERQRNPGHGVCRMVKAAAPRIELTTVFG